MGKLNKFEGTLRYLVLKPETAGSTPYPKIEKVREDNIDTPSQASTSLKSPKAKNSPFKSNKTKRARKLTATAVEVDIKKVMNTNGNSRSTGYTSMTTKQKNVLMPNKIQVKKLKGKAELLTPNGIESGGKSPFLSAKVNTCCEVVLKYIDDELGKKESSMAKLFGDEPVPIDMQITTVKIPVTPTRFKRILLPHSLVTDTTDVCLIVPDVKGKKNDIEAAIDHYRHIITTNGVPRVSQIVPLLQLRTEYHQYEMRRKLSSMCDVFLVDGRISHFMMPLLGKYFYTSSHKIPVPFRYSTIGEQFKSNIEQALSKTTLKLSSGGDTFSVQVGHSQLSTAQLASNIETVGDQLTTIIPGGWDNIRFLSLKTSRSISFPLYLSLKSPNNVVMPVINSKRPKAAQPVEGELSTTGGQVRVMPDGKVFVKNISKKRKAFRVEFGDSEETEVPMKKAMSDQSIKGRKKHNERKKTKQITGAR